MLSSFKDYVKYNEASFARLVSMIKSGRSRRHLIFTISDSDIDFINQMLEKKSKDEGLEFIRIDCRTLSSLSEFSRKIFVENSEKVVLSFDHIFDIPESEDLQPIAGTIEALLSKDAVKNYGNFCEYKYCAVFAIAKCESCLQPSESKKYYSRIGYWGCGKCVFGKDLQDEEEV